MLHERSQTSYRSNDWTLGVYKERIGLRQGMQNTAAQTQKHKDAEMNYKRNPLRPRGYVISTVNLTLKYCLVYSAFMCSV